MFQYITFIQKSLGSFITDSPLIGCILGSGPRIEVRTEDLQVSNRSLECGMTIALYSLSSSSLDQSFSDSTMDLSKARRAVVTMFWVALTSMSIDVRHVTYILKMKFS
jgi:hypothetical protein